MGETRWERDGLELGISKSKLLYIEWINKVIPYCTGNDIQYPVINHNGKEYTYVCVCVCVFHNSSAGKESTCNAGDTGSILGWKIPWRTAWQPNPVLLPGKSQGQREPGGLWSMGLQRVRLDWRDKARACTHTHITESLFCTPEMNTTLQIILQFKNKNSWAFPVQWLRLSIHLKGCRFDPWLGNCILHADAGTTWPKRRTLTPPNPPKKRFYLCW